MKLGTIGNSLTFNEAMKTSLAMKQRHFVLRTSIRDAKDEAHAAARP